MRIDETYCDDLPEHLIERCQQALRLDRMQAIYHLRFRRQLGWPLELRSPADQHTSAAPGGVLVCSPFQAADRLGSPS